MSALWLSGGVGVGSSGTSALTLAWCVISVCASRCFLHTCRWQFPLAFGPLPRNRSRMVSTVTPPQIDTSLSVYAYVYIWWMKPYLSLRPLCFRFFVALKLRCLECTSPCCAASLSFI